MPVTLREIANKLGVSMSLVSLAIRGKDAGKHKLSRATVKRIRSMAKEMGYRPNRVASSLVKGKTHVIGVLLPFLHNDFYERIFTGINRIIVPKYIPLLALHDYDGIRENSALESFIENRVDGVIAAYSGAVESIELYREVIKEYDIPIVLVDGDIKGLNIPIVRPDSFNNTYEAVKALANMGHEQILYGSIADGLDSVELCKEGYRQAMTELNLKDQIRIISRPVSVQWSEESLEDFACQILNTWQELSPRPTALLVNTDWLAYAILALCQKRKIQVPEDLSLMGLDDNRPSAFPGINLSSVRTNLDMIGRNAANMLLQIIDGYSPDNIRVVLPVEVIMRKSTKPL